MEAFIGSVVFSKAGRDKGKYFAVVALEDEYAYICDGVLRKCDRPKKKKLKHLSVTNTVCEAISESIKEKGKVSNSEVRKALAQYAGLES